MAAKRSPFLKTVVVVGVAAALGAYAYFVESKKEDKPEKVKEKVVSFDKARAKEVTLAPAGGETVRVVKEGGGWTLQSPTAAAADANEVDALLGSLQNVEAEEVVSEQPARLADFGLDPPKNTVTVRLEGNAPPLTLLLGDKTPDSSGVYAKTPDRPRVFTVATFLEGSVGKKAFDLRDRSVLHVKRDDVKAIEVTGPEGTWALARDARGEWAFTAPLATRAGRWSVDSLLGTLESLRMESVAAETATDLKPFGLDKPVRTVKLALLDGSTKTLEIGSSPADKKHHAREASRGLVAVIAGALVDDLAKGMGELRAKRLLDVATYEVEGFETEGAGQPKRTYARSSQKGTDGVDVYTWKRTAPDAKDLDTNKVQDALFLVGGLEVQEFVDQPASPDTYGLDAPALRVTLRYGAGKPPTWFEVGRKGDGAWARREGDVAVLKLDPAKTDELVKAFGGL